MSKRKDQNQTNDQSAKKPRVQESLNIELLRELLGDNNEISAEQINNFVNCSKSSVSKVINAALKKWKLDDSNNIYAAGIISLVKLMPKDEEKNSQAAAGSILSMVNALNSITNITDDTIELFESLKQHPQILRSFSSMQANRGFITKADFKKVFELCGGVVNDNAGDVYSINLENLRQPLLSTISTVHSYLGLPSDDQIQCVRRLSTQTNGNMDYELVQLIVDLKGLDKEIISEKAAHKIISFHTIEAGEYDFQRFKEELIAYNQSKLQRSGFVINKKRAQSVKGIVEEYAESLPAVISVDEGYEASSQIISDDEAEDQYTLTIKALRDLLNKHGGISEAKITTLTTNATDDFMTVITTALKLQAKFANGPLGEKYASQITSLIKALPEDSEPNSQKIATSIFAMIKSTINILEFNFGLLEQLKKNPQILSSVSSMQTGKGMILDADFNRLIERCSKQNGELDYGLLRSITGMQKGKGMISDDDLNRLIGRCSKQNGELDYGLLSSITGMQHGKGMISDADLNRLIERFSKQNGELDYDLLSSITGMQHGKGMISDDDLNRLIGRCSKQNGELDYGLLRSITGMQNGKGMISDDDLNRLIRGCSKQNGELDYGLLSSITGIQNGKGMISDDDLNRLIERCSKQNGELDYGLLRSISGMQNRKGMISDADLNRLIERCSKQNGELDYDLLSSITGIQNSKGMISDADFNRLIERCSKQNGELDYDFLRSISGMQHSKGMIADSDFNRLIGFCSKQNGELDYGLLRSITGMQNSKGMISESEEQRLRILSTDKNDGNLDHKLATLIVKLQGIKGMISEESKNIIITTFVDDNGQYDHMLLKGRLANYVKTNLQKDGRGFLNRKESQKGFFEDFVESLSHGAVNSSNYEQVDNLINELEKFDREQVDSYESPRSNPYAARQQQLQAVHSVRNK